MHSQLLLPVLFIFLSTCATADDCNPDCAQTEYKSYVECIQKRIKRSINCPYSSDQSICKNCDCNFCVVNICPQHCIQCCENTPPCISRGCCHRTCHSRCKSLSCRSDCRKKCAEKLISEGINITDSNRRHNVTTIIELQNTINNTNIIDIPIAINNTNYNNISENSDEEQKTNEQQEEEILEDNCCYVYSPRKCLKISTYPYIKCVQYRKNVCGSVCVASIIHEQPIRQCSHSPKGVYCQEKTVYIPQPKPKCSYQPVWPYVACGIPHTQFCGSCYEHYNTQQLPMGCSYNCYDDGYGIGPYYRKGPFYRPSYSHIPSCYQTGMCSVNWNHNYPAYGSPSYPPNSYQPNVVIQTKPSNPPNQNIKPNSTSIHYYSIPIFPPHITSGYPYPPPPPIYILPPEVDIQAVITHPEKENRYAQITISKPGQEDEILSADDE